MSVDGAAKAARWSWKWAPAMLQIVSGGAAKWALAVLQRLLVGASKGFRWNSKWH
jgi:hypothetical protein